MKKLLLLGIIMIQAWTLSAQSASFKFEGIKRKYLLYLPESYDPKKSYPLVYNFHGGGMTAVEQMYYTRMNRAADKFNFIVVYPTGIKADWNVGFDMEYLKGTNDVGFIKALTDTLKNKYPVNDKAIFATGLSRGGFFCHRLATEMAGVFAAIASVGGPLPDSVKIYNRSETRVAVMQVHGTSDDVVQYDGKPGGYSSAMSTFNYWREHNGLNGKQVIKTVIDKNKADHTSVSIEQIQDKHTGVALVTIRQGGHTWPGSDPFNIGFPLGYTSKDIDINEVMWEFFNKNRKR